MHENWTQENFQWKLVKNGKKNLHFLQETKKNFKAEKKDYAGKNEHKRKILQEIECT